MNEIIDKWKKVGFLNGITDDALILKVANSFELAKTLLGKSANNRERIFPMIYRCLVKVDGNRHDVLYPEFVFTEENLTHLINLDANLGNTELFEKYLDKINVDIEAYLCRIICEMFITEQNNKYKKYIAS